MSNNSIVQQDPADFYATSSGMSSESSIIFLVIDFTILIPVGYFHYLIKCMVRREKEEKGHGLIKNLLECYVIIVPFVFFCCMTYVHIILRYTSIPSRVFGDGFCYVYEIFAYSGGMYVGAFSLVAAIVKYWFIVYNAEAKRIGEQKIKTIFTAAYCIIPIIIALMNSLSNGTTDQNMWVNRCWRKRPEQDVKDNTTIEEDHDFFCYNKEYDLEDYVGTDASNFLIPILRGMCGSVKLLNAVFFSNIAELVLYFLIFRYLNRYL